jgi:membrane-associated HD superfamily phosphohydrolase
MTTANDEFSLHPLHIFSSSQYSNFVLGKTLERVFRSFSSSNLGKNLENMFRNLFSRQKKLRKTHSKFFLRAKLEYQELEKICKRWKKNFSQRINWPKAKDIIDTLKKI